MTLTELQQRATITVEQAASVLQIARGTAYEAARTGDIPTIRIGRRLLVPVPRLLQMLGATEGGE